MDDLDDREAMHDGEPTSPITTSDTDRSNAIPHVLGRSTG
jgi:hypothetical protein